MMLSNDNMGGQSHKCAICGKYLLTGQGLKDHQKICTVRAHERIIPSDAEMPPFTGTMHVAEISGDCVVETSTNDALAEGYNVNPEWTPR